MHFDVYYLESALYSDGLVEQTARTLIDNGFTYEQDGARLRTTDFGDDQRDRVMHAIRRFVYLFSARCGVPPDEIAAWFQTVINEQGADHHNLR